MTSHVRISAAEYRQTKRAAKNKYGAKKVTIDGITFDSKREGAYYTELRQRQILDEVTAVEMQKPYVLKGPDGSVITTYRADFCFFDVTAGRYRVVDVKGGKATQTDVFRLKRKMMKSFLGIDVEVVT